MSAIRHVLDQPCMADHDVETRLWQDITGRGRETLRVILEASMETELTLRLGYAPYQRNPQLHSNSRNGCYERNLDTQFGPLLGLRVPRPRRGPSDWQVLERYRRRVPWVDRLAQEMLLAGGTDHGESAGGEGVSQHRLSGGGGLAGADASLASPAPAG